MTGRYIAAWTAALCLLLVPASYAYAGGINAAEQKIIDYYNGTVSYNGKDYQFTEAAKQQAYNKLIADDVDLTEAQAASAIRQANANLQQGIDRGYLTEVSGGGTTSGGETEAGNGGSGSEGTSGSGDDESGSTSGNGGSGSEGTSGNGDDESGSTAGDGGSESGSGNTAGDGGSRSGNTAGDGAFTDAGEKDGTSEETEKTSYSDAKKIDVEALLKEALEEGEYASAAMSGAAEEDGSSDGWTATVEQFLRGKVTVAKENGDTVLSAGLPVKNTGYYRGNASLAVQAAGIVCGLLVVVVFGRGKRSIRLPVLTAVTGLAVIFALGGGMLESEMGQWKSIWILGAPEYAYASGEGQRNAEADEGDAAEDGESENWYRPIAGEQYGEILCEEAGLRTPLYYGDTEEILEQGAGTYTGSSLPGEGAEILIGGHDITFFAPLQKIREGMLITVKTVCGEYIYETTGAETLDVMEYKKREPEAEELTLYTCYPFGEEETLRSGRYFVYARKIGES